MVLLLFSLSTHLGCAMQNKKKEKVQSKASKRRGDRTGDRQAAACRKAAASGAGA